MSIEPRKVWQVIRYIDNINHDDESSTITTQHVKTAGTHPQQSHDDEEDDEDSYNHLIEEQDIISYDSESSSSAQLMDSPTVTRPPSAAALDLAASTSTPLQTRVLSANGHDMRQEPIQVPAPRLVYVKLGDPADHVITVNRPMVDDLNRMLVGNRFGPESSGGNGVCDDKTSGGAVNMSTGSGEPMSGTTTTPAANDEELTSLTWLQDKNLIQGINLTTSKNSLSNGGGGTSNTGNSAPQTESAVTITPNCDNNKHKQIVTVTGSDGTQVLLQHNGTGSSDTTGKSDQQPSMSPGALRTSAISELASKILSSTTLPPSISHLLPSTKTIITGRNDTVTQQQQQQLHVHKKYRREEHVKITKQQQQQQLHQHHNNQSQQQHPLQLTPKRSSQSPNVGLLSPYSDRSLSSRKYSDESLGYHSPSPRSASKVGAGSKQKHPVNVPYNPFVHTTNKPPLSFSSLIFMAIENATEKALPVKEIYAWIVKHFPYFKTAPTGWKNSVRHNLSLNKCFQKVEKAPNMGKGSLWKVEQQYRQVLMQALTRSPYHQFAGTMDKTGGSYSDDNLSGDTNNNNLCNSSSPSSSSNLSSTSSSLSTSPTGIDPHHHHQHQHLHHNQPALKTMSNGRPFDPVLFPYLSKEISKLDTNNNNGLYANYNLSFVDSESESTGYYDLMERGGDGPNAYHPHNRCFSYVQYPYDNHVDNSTDNMDDVNAATAMLALKHGPKIFDGVIRNGQPVITSSPSEDHTYSAGNENADEVDKPIEGGDSIASTNGLRNGGGAVVYEQNVYDRAYSDPSENDLEEQRRKAEGVDALLNLAGFASNTSQVLMKRRASSDMVSFSNESSMDCSSAVIFSSPSPTKRSKTRYLPSPVAALR